MGDRRLSRELALQALFSFDVNKLDPALGLEQFCAQREDELTDMVKPFFLGLVEGVLAAMDDIDGLLNKYSKNWRLSRMPVVDRNIIKPTNRAVILNAKQNHTAVGIGQCTVTLP